MPVLLSAHVETIPLSGTIPDSIEGARVRFMEWNDGWKDVSEAQVWYPTNDQGNTGVTIQDPGVCRLKFVVKHVNHHCREVVVIDQYPSGGKDWHEDFQLHADGSGISAKGEKITVHVVELATGNAVEADVVVESVSERDPGATDPSTGKWTTTKPFASDDDLTITVVDTNSSYPSEKLQIRSPRKLFAGTLPVPWTAEFKLGIPP